MVSFDITSGCKDSCLATSIYFGALYLCNTCWKMIKLSDMFNKINFSLLTLSWVRDILVKSFASLFTSIFRSSYLYEEQYWSTGDHTTEGITCGLLSIARDRQREDAAIYEIKNKNAQFLKGLLKNCNNHNFENK